MRRPCNVYHVGDRDTDYSGWLIGFLPTGAIVETKDGCLVVTDYDNIQLERYETKDQLQEEGIPRIESEADRRVGKAIMNLMFMASEIEKQLGPQPDLYNAIVRFLNDTSKIVALGKAAIGKQ